MGPYIFVSVNFIAIKYSSNPHQNWTPNFFYLHVGMENVTIVGNGLCIWYIVFYRLGHFHFHFHFSKQLLDLDFFCKRFLDLVIMEDFFLKLERNFINKTRNLGNEFACIVWEGYVDKYGYGVQYVNWPTEGRKREGAHRLAYMIRHKISRNDMPSVDNNNNRIECSHLCQNKLCVNPDHIILETHAQNQDRIHCKGQGFCAKCHEPHCLLCTNIYFLLIILL